MLSDLNMQPLNSWGKQTSHTQKKKRKKKRKQGEAYKRQNYKQHALNGLRRSTWSTVPQPRVIQKNHKENSKHYSCSSIQSTFSGHLLGTRYS